MVFRVPSSNYILKVLEYNASEEFLEDEFDGLTFGATKLSQGSRTHEDLWTVNLQSSL